MTNGASMNALASATAAEMISLLLLNLWTQYALAWPSLMGR
jgi:hypothetical protein